MDASAVASLSRAVVSTYRSASDCARESLSRELETSGNSAYLLLAEEPQVSIDRRNFWDAARMKKVTAKAKMRGGTGPIAVSKILTRIYCEPHARHGTHAYRSPI